MPPKPDDPGETRNGAIIMPPGRKPPPKRPAIKLADMVDLLNNRAAVVHPPPSAAAGAPKPHQEKGNFLFGILRHLLILSNAFGGFFYFYVLSKFSKISYK